MFCNKCGTELADDSQFCRKCGQPQSSASSSATSGAAAAVERGPTASAPSSSEVGAALSGRDNISTIKDLFEHPFFLLEIEKEVRASTNSYLKTVLSVLTALLAIAAAIGGFEASSLVKEARRNYNDQAEKLKAEAAELSKNVDKLRTDILDQEKWTIDVEKKSGEAEIQAGSLVNKMSQEVSQAKAANSAAQRAQIAARKAQDDAQNAQNDALKAIDKAKLATTGAEDAAKGAESAESKATKSAENIRSLGDAMTGKLDPVIDMNTRLLESSEFKSVLVQGRGVKNPCVELDNRVYWSGAKFESYGVGQGHNASDHAGVRFSILHIHFHPLTLRVQISRNGCGDLDHGSEYTYKLNDKSNYTRRHPLPGTAFSFRLAGVFYPKISFTFATVEIGPDENLLKCQGSDPELDDEQHCRDLTDDTRHLTPKISQIEQLPPSPSPGQTESHIIGRQSLAWALFRKQLSWRLTISTVTARFSGAKVPQATVAGSPHAWGDALSTTPSSP